MTNSLIKNTTIETVDGTEEVPAIPYSPAAPARTVYETRQVCAFRYPPGSGTYTYVTGTDGQVQLIFQPNASGIVSSVAAIWSCQNELVPVTYPGTPEQPFVPGHSINVTTVVSGYNLGWNAGARSIKVFTADASVEFKARVSLVGAIVGMNLYDGIESRYNGNTIDYGFFLARGIARIIENGIIKSFAGAYTESTVFKITRSGTGITYYMAGVSVGTATGAPTTSGWLEASLYSGTDEVFDPVITQISSPDLTTQTATLAATLPPLGMFAASGPYAEMAGVLPALTLSAEAGLTLPAYAVMDAQMPPLSMLASGLTGEVASMVGSMPAFRMLAADHPYAEMFSTLPPLTVDLSAYEGNFNASIGAVAMAGSSMTLVSFLVVSMLSSGTVASTLVVQTSVSAEMLSQAAFGSTFAAGAVLDAVMLSLASSGTVLGVPESDNETWVINLDSGGTTSYSNYAFNSFARIGGKYYGASTAGIFELEGDTDAGAPIRARISLGELDFGTSMLKTVSECYVGMSGAGHLFVKLIAEGSEYIYKTRGYSDKLKQQRVTFGKGLRTNYVELELFNEDGADFELDTVEFHVVDLTRRI